MDTEITDVIFRILNGEVLALFPGLAGTNDPAICQSYMHIGQHGSANPLFVLHGNRSTPASPAQYADLKRELESEPYRYNLRVVSRMTAKHRAARLEQIAL